MPRLFSDPFERLNQLQHALDSFRGSDWLNRSTSGGGAYPPLNVFVDGDEFVVVTELPGIRREDVAVEVQNNRLRIAGAKRILYGEVASVHRRERSAGQFDRTLAIPFEVDAEGVKADYKNGVLTLRLPRAERDKPKSIAIN